MWNRNIYTFLACDSEYIDSNIVIFGAPFDSTTSYRPGARFASKTMRAESYGLETYSPYQNLDMIDTKIFDGGDLELPFGDTKQALADIKDKARQIYEDNKIPYLIGGEHLVSLPAIEAGAEKYRDLVLIHIDAHTDLREDYLGNSFSHASVIRRAWDILGDGRIYQFGIRSGDRSEWEWARAGHTKLQPFNFNGLDKVLKLLTDKPVYLTVDLDVLDPSVFPGTGTPEAGGVDFLTLLESVIDIINSVKVVGCDIVELSPPLDPSGISTAVALKLMREMLLRLDKEYYLRFQ